MVAQLTIIALSVFMLLFSTSPLLFPPRVAQGGQRIINVLAAFGSLFSTSPLFLDAFSLNMHLAYRVLTSIWKEYLF